MLGSIPTEDEVRTPGSGPVAFGALPFDRRAAATLVVPVGARSVAPPRAHGGHDHRSTRPATPSHRRGRPTVAPPAPRAPTEIAVRSVRAPRDWCAAVARGHRHGSAHGELTKVVLARELEVTTDRPLDPATLLGTAAPRATPQRCASPIDGFVGASPELLVSRVGDIVRAQPMAGTTARTGEPEADQRRAAELLASHKNRAEHQITIDMVHDTLLPWCSFLDAEPEPSVVAGRTGAAPGHGGRGAAVATGAAGARTGRRAAPDTGRRRVAPGRRRWR